MLQSQGDCSDCYAEQVECAVREHESQEGSRGLNRIRVDTRATWAVLYAERSNEFYDEQIGSMGVPVVPRGIESVNIGSCVVEFYWVLHFGIFGPTGTAGEMPGFFHYGLGAVGTTVVPPGLPRVFPSSGSTFSSIRGSFLRGPRPPGSGPPRPLGTSLLPGQVQLFVAHYSIHPLYVYLCFSGAYIIRGWWVDSRR